MEITDQIQKDLLTNEFDPFLHHNDASRGQRILNYIVDNVIMRFTITYVTGYGIGFILGTLFPEMMREINHNNNKFFLYVMAYIIVCVNYIIYYTVSEKLFKGQTIGKLVTGTRAIRDDGQDLTIKDAFLRSVSRLVPLEPFSAFGVPWHDSWTQTRVVRTR